MNSQDPIESHRRMLRTWQVAILRFAVTLDNADRLSVIAIAHEIDRGGGAHDDPANFSFFRRMSSDLCSSILRQHDSADAILRQYLARIQEPRMKRAFASAIEGDKALPTASRSIVLQNSS